MCENWFEEIELNVFVENTYLTKAYKNVFSLESWGFWFLKCVDVAYVHQLFVYEWFGVGPQLVNFLIFESLVFSKRFSGS